MVQATGQRFEQAWTLCGEWADERAQSMFEDVSLLLDDLLAEQYADAERNRCLDALDAAAKAIGQWIDPFASPEAIAAEAIDLARGLLGEVRVARERLLAAMPYPDYLRTPEWQERRTAALRRAHYRCQLCNRDGRLEVHHRTYERRGRERPDDVTVLCRRCHGLFHQLASVTPTHG